MNRRLPKFLFYILFLLPVSGLSGFSAPFPGEGGNSVVSSVDAFFNQPGDKENPFTLYVDQGILNIKYNNPDELLNGEVVVYNLLGQEITRKKLEVVPVNQVSIPLQNTCYLVRINYSGKVHTQKIIVTAN